MFEASQVALMLKSRLPMQECKGTASIPHSSLSPSVTVTVVYRDSSKISLVSGFYSCALLKCQPVQQMAVAVPGTFGHIF